MFGVYRSSEKPGKEERECKGDFQIILEKVSFINPIYLNHLFEGEDCGFFCSQCHPIGIPEEEDPVPSK